MARGQVAFDQEPLILGVEDSRLDVRPGEGLDRLPRFPEAQGDDLGLLTGGPPQQPRTEVPGCFLVGLDARLLDVAGVGGGVVGADRAAPGPCDHSRLPSGPISWVFAESAGCFAEHLVQDAAALLRVHHEADVITGEVDHALEEWERRAILDALQKAHGVQARAAKILGITERSLWYRVKKLKIQVRMSGDNPDLG